MIEAIPLELKQANEFVSNCKNRECTRTKCERHYSHIDWSVGPPWRSFAEFEGTKYCSYGERRENK